MNLTEFERVLKDKYNVTLEQYEQILKDCTDKELGIINVEYQDIIEKYGLNMHYDSLRKSQQTPFGTVMATQYLQAKNNKSNNCLNDVRELLGEQYIVKQQIHNDKLKVNKLKRDLIPCITVAEELKDFMIENNFQFSFNNIEHYSPIVDESEYTMILPISDFHIGCLINNCEGNSFNWAIANKRVSEYLKECFRYIHLYNISKVYVISCGDMIENSYMRFSQIKSCEFEQSEQINKAIDIIYRIISTLSTECNVIYAGLAGNHDRMCGDKKKAYEGDNANVIINEQIKNYIKLSNSERISVIDTKYSDKEIRLTINGVSCKFIHGDDIPKIDKATLSKLISSDNTFYDLLVVGHWHNFTCMSENFGRYVVTNGCLSGRNTYSKDFFCTTDASQTIVILGKNKVELIKDVNLSIV